MNTESPALLKSKDIAAIYNVTDREVTKWHAAGIIPSEIHVGRVIRFDASKVAAALKRHKQTRQPKPRGPQMVPVI